MSASGASACDADTILLKSLSGDVAVLGRILGADLQVRDLGGTESVDFLLSNLQNDVDRINAFSNGGNGRISSLDFRDADGFRNLLLVEQPNEQSIGSGRQPVLMIAIDKVALLLSRGRAAVVRLIT